MDTSSSRSEQSFLKEWILANIVGLPVLVLPYNVGFLLLMSFAILSDGGADDTMFYILMGIALVVVAIVSALLGTWLGFFQWSVLRKRIPHAGKWITATAVGMAAGASLGVLLYALIFAVFSNRPDGAYFSFAWEYLAFGPTVGLTIGASQGSLLKKWGHDGKLWITALPVLFTLGMLFAFLNRVSSTFVMPIHGMTKIMATLFPNIKSVYLFFVFDIFTAITALLAVSLLTGILLDWLLHSAKQPESEQ